MSVFFYQPRQHGWYCLHLVSRCVSSWQNVVLETPIVAGTITKIALALSPLQGVYTSVCGPILTTRQHHKRARCITRLHKGVVKIKMKVAFEDGCSSSKGIGSTGIGIREGAFSPRRYTLGPHKTETIPRNNPHIHNKDLKTSFAVGFRLQQSSVPKNNVYIRQLA